MNFYIDKLLLWLKDGTLRTLPFSNDRVNVITGNSKTGKTAVLEIIDYCLCGGKDTVVISYEHIGESVAWYGIRFAINDKTYTIARGEITERGDFSEEYYFSQTGEIPEIPCVKMDEFGIKTILEAEFSINDEITISYGGKSIKKSTRLSFRYFLVYNTLSKDVIDNGKYFFDKMHLERYRDVWSQVFDLSVGVINLDIIKKQKELHDLLQELDALAAEKKKQTKKVELYESDVQKIVKHAKESGLVGEKASNTEALEIIKGLIENGISNFATDFSVEQEYERLQLERENAALQLVKLKRFKNSYSEYRDSLKGEADSLRPITYIQKEFGSKTHGEYREFLNNLSNELVRVTHAIKEKRPFEFDVDRKIRELSDLVRELDIRISQTAHVRYSPISTAEKLVSLGEIKAEYGHLDSGNKDLSSIDATILAKTKEYDALKKQHSGINERRSLIIETLNEYVQTYIKMAESALDEYGKYCAWFDYKKAALTLRKNKSASIANISSSSDHLFMHLCLFAGLHHYVLSEKSPYIPSFLIIDQPSRPYFNRDEYDYKDSENEVSKKGDWSKVKNIFTLWDNFFNLIHSQKRHFQIIMLEHVSENAWMGCNNISLVEIFDGVENALIPPQKKVSSTECIE